VTVTGWFDRPGIVVEVAIYAGLGFLWALPFRGVFRGIGRADPERRGRADGHAGQAPRPAEAGREDGSAG
jgi:hypothetical protein